MNIDAQLKEFDSLYTELVAGRIAAIEYGDRTNPGSMLSFLRVRVISTPVGSQIAVKELHLGQEGSGIYFELLVREGLKLHLAARLEHIHRPCKFTSRVRASAGSLGLSFFGVASLEHSCPLQSLKSLTSGHKPVQTVQF